MALFVQRQHASCANTTTVKHEVSGADGARNVALNVRMSVSMFMSLNLS
jgi:hypothetical protein